MLLRGSHILRKQIKHSFSFQNLPTVTLMRGNQEYKFTEMASDYINKHSIALGI